MRKPAIPTVPRIVDDRTRFDSSVKECLETMMGRTTDPLAELSRDTATLDNCVEKINEILRRMQ